MTALLLALLLAVPPSVDPERPVVLLPSKDAFRGKEHLQLSVQNRASRRVSVRPSVAVERSRGDGTWEAVFRLRLEPCPPGDSRERPIGDACVTLAPGATLALTPWDFYTSGADQCAPRPPGLRAYKGAYRLVLEPCAGERIEPASRFITWE